MVVDRGYRGHGVDKTQVLISGTRQGLTSTLAADLRRRAVIEPEIGYMKTDGLLARSRLKGTSSTPSSRYCAAASTISASSWPG